MNRLVIQVFRHGEWRNLTTIPFENGNNRSDGQTKYARAYREATKQITGWRGHFTDRLRIAEPTINGGYMEAKL